MANLHLIKLCAGAEGVDDLADRIEHRVRTNKASGAYSALGRVHDHLTRMHPKREAELRDGGSIYWVIKGVILARQRILGFEKRTCDDHITRTAILLDPDYVLTKAQPRRAFQGWRYLNDDDAPGDAGARGPKAPSPELGRTLAELGLL